ncbi:hypothetical protein [Streptomyces sp. NPDC094032]|uniref:hypothetical protein n=1 Tax=Streptomyces sp. NPDC094032 TaxID=3155308 RepID=UPI003324C8B8
MTITPVTRSAQRTRRTLLHFARGILTSAVIGGSLAGLVVGTVIENPPLLVAGLVVPLVYGLLVLAAGAPARRREAAVVHRTALGKIESRQATGGGDTSDVLVRFEATVAPDDEPPYRVEFTQFINVVDLPDYQPGGTVVVRYPPDRPWKVEIVKRPTPQGEDRAAGARIDSVPGPALTESLPEGSSAAGFVNLFALLLAAAAVVFLYRAELFGPDTDAPPPSAAAPSSTTGVSSSTGTVSFGPGQSMLDPGALRLAVTQLTQGDEKRQALTVVVQDRLLTVVFAPTGTQAPGFDLDALPYARIPALVREARTGLGVRSPQTWQLTAESLTGSLTLRIGVTGADGAGSLEADGDGRVVSRTSAH